MLNALAAWGGSMHLFDYLDSGNGFKVRLVLSLLQKRYRWTELDIDKGETRTAEFLRLNGNGRIPTLVLDDGRALAESNAIIWFLAEGTALLPNDTFARAQALQWMFFEQYSHEPYVATPRYIVRHLAADHPRRAELPQRLALGRAALAVMEAHLVQNNYFVADSFTIADVALFAYTHVAEDGGHDLSAFPAVGAWLERCSRRDRFIALLDRPHDEVPRPW